ncbi:MAG TPA: Flp pilus assembly protein CpaB [Candidatus Limnocylindrales bacterium]|nr:Flp pilus assembly protein CpaB [Candidatus Limnocylindrales bacterium]
MKRSNRLVLLIGIFLALVAFVLIIILLGGGGIGSGAAAPSAAPTTTSVVVATKDIALGDKIQGAQVGLKDIPIAERPATAFGDTSLVIGQVARTSVVTGQLVTSVVLNGGGSVENIEVPAGFVAMSVQVDQATGVGTIIKPGDFVDVISGFTGDKVPLVVPALIENTLGYEKVDPGLYNPTTVKVLSQGLQVLGTLLPPPPDNVDAQASPDVEGGTTSLNGQQQIVILAVPLQDAEVIKFSQLDGSITLVLRSSEDCTTKPADGITYCPVVATTGITLKRMIDDRAVLPPQVVQVLIPDFIPGTGPSPTPKP